MRAGIKVVGAKGFEPSTSWSRTRRASQAALRPDNTRSHGKSCIRAEHKNSTAHGPVPETLRESTSGPSPLADFARRYTPTHSQSVVLLCTEAKQLHLKADATCRQV